MKPLICPQCGGKITDYTSFQHFATCDYCGTRFHIEPQKQIEKSETYYKPLKTSSLSPNIVIGFVIGAVLLLGGVVLIGTLNRSNSKQTASTSSTPQRYAQPTPIYTPTLAPTPNPNLLEFGGKGTGNGLFQNADAIAVDSKGRIYVGDETLRVQQFDEKGNFLKLWQIPSQTKHYKRARSIQKIAVDDQDQLYVLVGGVVQMWEQNTVQLPEVSFHAAPNPMVDFALRSDGVLLMVAIDDEAETLIYMNKNERVMRRIPSFMTEPADASMSPFQTGLASIRIAVDGSGNIFSIFALGDLGTYQLSYNDEEFKIYRFSPEGKYVDKFVRTLKSVGIAIDNQSRIYISDDNSIIVYNTTGESISIFLGLQGIDAIALDKQNNVYAVANDRVVKRAALQ